MKKILFTAGLVLGAFLLQAPAGFAQQFGKYQEYGKYELKSYFATIDYERLLTKYEFPPDADPEDPMFGLNRTYRTVQRENGEMETYRLTGWLDSDQRQFVNFLINKYQSSPIAGKDMFVTNPALSFTSTIRIDEASEVHFAFPLSNSGNIRTGGRGPVEIIAGESQMTGQSNRFWGRIVLEKNGSPGNFKEYRFLKENGLGGFNAVRFHEPGNTSNTRLDIKRAVETLLNVATNFYSPAPTSIKAMNSDKIIVPRIGGQNVETRIYHYGSGIDFSYR